MSIPVVIKSDFRPEELKTQILEHARQMAAQNAESANPERSGSPYGPTMDEAYGPRY